MRKQGKPVRTALTTLVGFVLGLSIVGCPSKTVVMTPQAVKTGDTIRWDGIDPQIGTYLLAIPDGLCETNPADGSFYEPVPGVKVYVMEVKQKPVECRVAQTANSKAALQYYEYYLNPASTPASNSPILKASPDSLMLGTMSPLLVGSCSVCSIKGSPFSGPGRGEKALPFVSAYVLMGTNYPQVLASPLGPSLPVISTSPSGLIQWNASSGPLTITFHPPSDHSDAPAPCTGTATSGSGADTTWALSASISVRCLVPNDARAQYVYPYDVTLGDNPPHTSQSSTYTMTIGTSAQ